MKGKLYGQCRFPYSSWAGKDDAGFIHFTG
jgi:hypothetical protein